MNLDKVLYAHLSNVMNKSRIDHQEMEYQIILKILKMYLNISAFKMNINMHTNA